MNISHTILIILILSLSTEAHSQRRGQRTQMQRIQSERIAFITSELDLTTAESKQFWPVYNEFEKKRNSLLEERRRLLSQFNENMEKMSAAEISGSADRFIALRVEDAQLHQEYHEKFKEILSPERVMLLYLAEEEFRNNLLRRLRRDPRGRQ